MSHLTYYQLVSKPLRWLAGEVKSPPMSVEARREMGFFRQLQEGEKLSLPYCRPMPTIGNGCHELRVNDKNKNLRLFYFMDSEAIVILGVGEKKTQKTSQATIELCQRRLKNYDEAKKQRSESNKRKGRMG